MADLKMSNTNVLVIDGRLTKDPQSGRTKGDQAWARFAIAHDDWRNGKAETDFWEVSCFGKTAEIAEKLRKGAPVIVEARLGRDRWTDKDGKEQDATRLFASRVRELAFPDRSQTLDREPVQDEAPF